MIYTITDTEIEKTDEETSYLFNVLADGIVFNQYAIDCHEDFVSWYSNFDSGMKQFDTTEKAKVYQKTKVIQLRKKAISVEKSITLG